jgi:hypothetical protein
MVGRVNDSIRCLPAFLAQDDTTEPYVAAGRRRRRRSRRPAGSRGRPTFTAPPRPGVWPRVVADGTGHLSPEIPSLVRTVSASADAWRPGKLHGLTEPARRKLITQSRIELNLSIRALTTGERRVGVAHPGTSDVM